MIFVDTGYWIALLDDRDELHGRALAWAKVATGAMISTDLVLVETVNHLTSRIPRERLHVLLDAVARTVDVEFVPTSDGLMREGFQLHRSRPDKDWSLTDCVSFVTMRSRSIQDALAYDRHFEQAGFRALLQSEAPTG